MFFKALSVIVMVLSIGWACVWEHTGYRVPVPLCTFAFGVGMALAVF